MSAAAALPRRINLRTITSVEVLGAVEHHTEALYDLALWAPVNRDASEPARTIHRNNLQFANCLLDEMMGRRS